jgi:cell division protein FtsN
MTLKNRRVFELRLGKWGLILFIGGMSALLFSLFLIGIVVGKHMEAYPERYSTGIPEMIGNRLFTALPPAGKAASPETEPGGKEEPPGADAEVVPTGSEPPGDKKGAVTPESRPDAVKNKGAEADAGRALPSGGVMRPSEATADGVGGETHRPPPVAGGEGAVKKAVPSPEGKPAGDSGTKKSPAPETAAPQKGRYEIQAAAYRERAQAEQLVKKFTDFGFSSQVVMKEIPGKGQWFRVIVGGFENRGKAQEAADQLTGKVRGLKCVIRSSARKENGG